MKSFFIIILFMFSFIKAEEIKGRFSLVDSTATRSVKEGGIFRGVLEIWPLPKANVEDFKKYNNKVFLDYFYLTNINKVENSENNSEVFVLEGDFVLYTYFEKKDFIIFSHNGLNIPISINEIYPIKNELKEEKFKILNQDKLELKNKQWWRILYLIFPLLILIFVIKYIKKRRRLKKLERENILSIKKWETTFLECKSKENYEYIFDNNKEWIEICGGKTPQILEFLKEMNDVRYKKDWTDNDYKIINDYFDKIRRIF